MLDNYKDTQKVAYGILKNAVIKDKLSHAYLFEARGYYDVNNLALSFAKFLLCPYNYLNNELCLKCTQCQNIDKNCYLELKIINPDGMWIKKEQLEELQKEFSMTSVEGNKKIYIINHADRLNPASANTILKFLEEPAPNIIAILVTDNVYQVIDTIASRCQIVSLNNIQSLEKLSLVDKIKKIIKIPDTITDENISEKVDSIIKFVKYYEKNLLETILVTGNMWHENIIGREENIFAFGLMLLYYKDILHTKIGRKVEIFTDYIADINNISNNNELSMLDMKMKVINSNMENIKYNANMNLLIDKLIIELSGGVNND